MTKQVFTPEQAKVLSALDGKSLADLPPVADNYLLGYVAYWLIYKLVPRKGSKGKFDKIPQDKQGRNSNPNNSKIHRKIEEALKELERLGKGYGLSIPLIAHLFLVCVDLDDCIDENGNIKPWAQKIVDKLGSYTEISPSGTGLHIWVLVDEGCNFKTIKPMYNGHQIEILTGQGHVTYTGNTIKHVPLTNQTEFIKGFYKAKNQGSPVEEAQTTKSGELSLEDIKKLAEAKNLALWNNLFVKGDISAYGGDSSAADFSLVCLLIEVGVTDDQIDEIMRESAIYREKWERADYRERTIEKARKMVNEQQSQEEERGATVKERLALLQENLVWNLENDSVYDLRLPPTQNPIKRSVLLQDTSHGFAKNGETPLTKVWSKLSNKLSVNGTAFDPSGGRIVISQEKGFGAESKFNTFYTPKWEYTENRDKSHLFTKLIKNHFPNEDERGVFLTWVKFIIELHPERVQWAILHINRLQGTGRGTFNTIMECLLGAWNCNTVSLKDIMGATYQDAIHNKLYINVDETADDSGRGSNKFKVNDEMRGMITRTSQTMNLKFGKNGVFPVHYAMRLDTNNPDALVIPAEDRRMFVVESFEKPLEQKFWNEIHREMKGDEFIRQVWSYLQDFQPLKGVNPLGRAPMTERKRQLMAVSKGSLDECIDAIRDNEEIEFILQVDLFIVMKKPMDDNGEGCNIFKLKERVNAVISKNFSKFTTATGTKRQIEIERSRPMVWVKDFTKLPDYQKMRGEQVKKVLENSRRALYKEFDCHYLSYSLANDTVSSLI